MSEKKNKNEIFVRKIISLILKEFNLFFHFNLIRFWFSNQFFRLFKNLYQARKMRGGCFNVLRFISGGKEEVIFLPKQILTTYLS